MSKILAVLDVVQRPGQDYWPLADEARAEHAEIVAVMKSIRTPHLLHGQVTDTRVTFDFCCPENAQNFMLAHNTIDSLLSRVGGGA